MKRGNSNTEVHLSDPSTSYAVLIEVHQFAREPNAGSSRTRYLEDRPSVETGCRRLAELLIDPTVWGLSPQNCVVVTQPSRDDMLEAVHKAAAKAQDTLVVYYAGHGVVYPHSEDLHLAVPNTTKDKQFSAVCYADLRSILVAATHVKRKVVILDCCFSGLALLRSLSSDADVTGMADIEGTVVLTASHATKLALAPKGEPYPAFTGELINVLEQGAPGGGELLTMTDVFENIDAAMRRKGRPRPQQLHRGRGNRISIVRNRAPRAAPLQSEADQASYSREEAQKRRRRVVVSSLMAVALGYGLAVWALLPKAKPEAHPSTLAGLHCGQAYDTFDPGDGQVREEVSVKVVHDAACKGDFDAMEVAMDRAGFDAAGFSAAMPSQVVASWEKRKDRISLLQAIATLLERKPSVSQGGLEFRNGKRVATWERGAGTTPDSQLRWSGYFDCSRLPDRSHPACELLDG
ncbi:caspase domain-containing protein [Streptomyces sp. NPDC014864]|uniref:caspase family protein n=1 Tax=Streptomyces sp. NPDC014864 TaxID=3364924 RepID=UPI003701A3D5